MFKTFLCAVTAISLCGFMLLAAPRNFIPDYVFEGSSVSNLHTLGQASWQAAQGEITATPHGSAGGWLVLDRSFQDVEFNASFRCSASCNAGVLLRAEKTDAGGWKGLYVSLSEGDMGSYELTIGSDGKEVSRKKLDRSTALFTRISAGPSISGSSKVPGFAELAPTLEEEKAEASKPAAPAGPPPGVGRRGPPQPEIHSSDWNTLDVIVDMDMVWVTLNSRRGGNSATNDRMMGYGPILLHAGGSGEVRFKDVAAKDLNPKTEPDEKTSAHFRMQHLDDFLYSWGAAAADVNHDGIPDVIAGPSISLVRSTPSTASSRRRAATGQQHSPKA